MARRAFKKVGASTYHSIEEKMDGYSFSRVIMPPRHSSNGGGIIIIFKNKDGHEKPIPYTEVKKMTDQVRASLINARKLTRRDKNAEKCDDLLLTKLMIAASSASRERHTYRRFPAYAPSHAAA